MAIALTWLLSVFLVVEFLVMLLLDLLSFTSSQARWLDPLIDACVVAVAAVYATPWVLAKANINIRSTREWIQLKSALIVFAVEAMLMLLIPLLNLDLDTLGKALLDALLFGLLSTSAVYLLVLLPEQALIDSSHTGTAHTPYFSPRFSSISGYLFAMVLVGLLLLTLARAQHGDRLARVSEQQLAGLSLVHSVLVHELHNSLQDALVMSRKADLIDFVSSASQHARIELEQDFQALVSTRRAYHSIRYFNNTGQVIAAVSQTQNTQSGMVPGRPLSDQQLLFDSLAMGPGEVAVAPVLNGDGMTPIRLSVPVFDEIGLHDGVLVIDLSTDYLISLLSESYTVVQSDLALVTDQGVVWLVNRGADGVDSKRMQAVLDWARQGALEHDVSRSDRLILGHYKLQQVPALLTGIERFSFNGGWPDWQLLAVVAEERLGAEYQQIVKLYLAVFTLIAVVAGTLVNTYTRIYLRQLEVERRIYNMAHHDSLTGLDNRQLFHEKLSLELAHASRNRTQMGLMYMDLDRFKPINDRYGHAVGDAALCEVVRRLRPALRASDSFARIGGDEFAVILPDVSGQSELETIADRLVQALAPELELSQHRCSVGISIGITLCGGELPAEQLIRQADIAMYAAKADHDTGYRMAETF